jgi:hypothetical protein
MKTHAHALASAVEGDKVKHAVAELDVVRHDVNHLACAALKDIARVAAVSTGRRVKRVEVAKAKGRWKMAYRAASARAFSSGDSAW